MRISAQSSGSDWMSAETGDVVVPERYRPCRGDAITGDFGHKMKSISWGTAPVVECTLWKALVINNNSDAPPTKLEEWLQKAAIILRNAGVSETAPLALYRGDNRSFKVIVVNGHRAVVFINGKYRIVR